MIRYVENCSFYYNIMIFLLRGGSRIIVGNGMRSRSLNQRGTSRHVTFSAKIVLSLSILSMHLTDFFSAWLIFHEVNNECNWQFCKFFDFAASKNLFFATVSSTNAIRSSRSRFQKQVAFETQIIQQLNQHQTRSGTLSIHPSIARAVTQ